MDGAQHLINAAYRKEQEPIGSHFILL